MNMEQSSRDQNTMGIIEEEDSLDFSQSVKSQLLVKTPQHMAGSQVQK